MSVHRDKRTGNYYVRWREGDRQRTKGGLSRSDALALDKEIARERAIGRPVLFRGDVPRLDDFAKAWLCRRATRKQVAANTLAFDATLLEKHILPFIGQLSLIDLTTRRLGEWQEVALAEGSSGNMVQRATQLLGAVLDQAIRDEFVLTNPVRSLESIGHTSREGVALAPSAIEKIRARFLELERPGDALIVSISAYVGLRPDELFAMAWRNLDGSRYFVDEKNVDGELVPMAPGKGGHRWVEIPNAVLRELKAWRGIQAKLGGLVFPRRSDGAPLRKADRNNWRRRQFRPACVDAGVARWADEKETAIEPALRPYDLRHTAVSIAAALGWTGPEMTEQFGHRIDTSARIYQHLIAELRGKRFGSVDELIASARGDSVLQEFREDAR